MPARSPGHQGLMSRVFGPHYVSPELLGLWFTETLGCGLLAYLLLTAGLPDVPAGNLHAAQQAAVLALTLGLASFVAGLYSRDLYGETRRLLAGSALGGCIALPAVWLAGRAAGIDFAAMAEQGVLGTLAGWVLFVLAVRLAFSHAVRANLFVRRVLVIAAGPDDAAAARLLAAQYTSRPGRLQVLSVLPASEAARLTPALLKGRKVWGIIVTDSARELLPSAQLAAWQSGDWSRCRLFGEAEFWESQLHRIDIDRPGAAGVVSLPAWGWHALDALYTRGGDILLSLALLLFTLPLMLLTALLIKLDSPGPVLYRQQRVGLHGRPFMLFKFRSMRLDAEARGPVWASVRDPRVTRIGAVMRATRIDELPQLMNILRGEMSFIGPRPERPHFVERLASVVPLYRERARVKPGLTGWAQVNYPYGASVEDARAKLSYDLYYVKHRGPALIVLILVSTVWVVLFQKGAR
jgi:exopolysaccharide biosynthesis polyprenyl glycosylphosphotransferase